MKTLSIDQLTALARVSFDPSLTIQSYISSCERLYERAQTHAASDHELELAFIYLLRAANTILQDLPSHPEYEFLPAHWRSRIQSVGLEYLRALAPVRSKLAARSIQTQQPEYPPLPNRSTITVPYESPSVSNSSRSPCPPSNLINHAPQTPIPSSLSSLPPPSKTKVLQQDTYHSAAAPNPHKSSDSSSSSNDWTILPPSAHIPILDTWHPTAKTKPVRRLSEPVPRPPASSPSSLYTISRSERNPLAWPVELGNGQGQRMSIALPVDQAMKTKQAATRQHPKSAGLTYPDRPPFKKNGLVDNPRFSAHIAGTTPHDPLRTQHGLQRHKSAHSGALSNSNHRKLYDLQDPTDLSPRSKSTQLRLPPLPLDSHLDSPPVHVHSMGPKRPLLPFRRASTDQAPTLSSNSSTLSGLKLIIRPRRTSWTSPSSKPKPDVSSPASSLEFGSDALVNAISPCSPPPSRPRRGSFGQSSTWRWLKGLNVRPSEKTPPNVLNSNFPNLYIHTSPAQDIKNHHPRPSATQHPTPRRSSLSDDSHFPQSYTSVSYQPSVSSRTRSTRPSIPSKPPRVPSAIQRSSQAFEYESLNRSDLNPCCSRTALRSMRCPKDLVGAFLVMAEPETEKGIELCGLLLGKVDPRDQNTLVVDTLLIPKQISGPDTCHTTHEDELFTFQNEMGLMTLGWIHTHPTQTCFLSSLDLHNHLSYQLMLPEAVAIVCSPRKEPSLGVFRLIDPNGIQSILKCRESSAFHPHSLDSRFIYHDADDHFTLVDDQAQLAHMKLDIVDLRS